MQKTTIREFRRNLKAHLESPQATLITSARAWNKHARAILIPIMRTGSKPGQKRQVIAQAKRLFQDAIAQAR